jgi:hypothetical protein
MKLNLITSKLLKEDQNKIFFFEYSLNVIFLVITTLYLWESTGLLGFCVGLIAAFVFCSMKFNTFKNIMYSYWSFAVFQFVIVLIVFLHKFSLHYFLLLNLIYFVIFFLHLYIFSSPMYYPRVRWWEYDFRYRGELKVNLLDATSELIAEGRLTDLRRQAGCLQCFKDLKLGGKYLLEIVDNSFGLFSMTVLTKREPNPGRGILYGVKFNLENKLSKSDYAKLASLWRKSSLAKMQKKFLKVKNNAS